MRLVEFPVFEIPVPFAYFLKVEMGALREMPQRGRFAMHKFSAKLDWNPRIRISMSEDASTDASTCFQHRNLVTGDAEIARGSKTGSARANYQNICIKHDSRL